MPDKEKVIKGLEDSLTNQGCGYMDGVGELYAVSGEDLQNALALLKEQEVKAGKWIPIESPTGVEAFGIKEMTVINVRCSVCGSEEDVSFTGYKYCPRCGVKMEGW